MRDLLLHRKKCQCHDDQTIHSKRVFAQSTKLSINLWWDIVHTSSVVCEFNAELSLTTFWLTNCRARLLYHPGGGGG